MRHWLNRITRSINSVNSNPPDQSAETLMSLPSANTFAWCTKIALVAATSLIEATDSVLPNRRRLLPLWRGLAAVNPKSWRLVGVRHGWPQQSVDRKAEAD